MRVRPWALVALVLAASAHAQGGRNWLEFAEGADGSMHYYDPERIQADGAFGPKAIRSLWLMETKAAKAGAKSSPPDSSRYISLYRVDCAGGQITPIQQHKFDAKGAVIATQNGGVPSYPVPNSLGEVFVQTSCTSAGLMGK